MASIQTYSTQFMCVDIQRSDIRRKHVEMNAKACGDERVWNWQNVHADCRRKE